VTTGLEVGMLLHPVNSWDWDRYESGRPYHAATVPDAQLWDETKHLGLLAEPLGFDFLFVTEHHRTPYGLSPNPLQIMAYFAGRTTRIALGTAVVVLPWHDPIRVAEDIALLDNLAEDRRITIGLGRGAAASEYEHLRIDQETSRERFDEAAEIVRAALSQEQFSYDGEIFHIPPTTIRPRPRHPDIADELYCAFAGQASLRAAAQRGLGMGFSAAKDYNAIRADVELFNSIRAEQGLEHVRPLVVLLLYCADTEETAYAGAFQHMARYYDDATRHYRLDEIGGLRGYEHYQAATVAQDFLGFDIWGTPDMCVAKIRELYATTDASRLLLNVRYGEMPADEAETSIRLFADDALPKLRELGRDGAARGSEEPEPAVRTATGI
jgi:alkanesulfonate monooxygenase SsuD/methylene tetrahydromethanopterin reductase-like flavin-dependent oxidoreductase (luciferase family)